MKSIFIYRMIFCNSGEFMLPTESLTKYYVTRQFKTKLPTYVLATYCFVMHERLFPMEKKPDDFRTVSNILYNEVKKHKENRHLNYVFDDDFVSKQQEQCNKAYLMIMTHKLYHMT